MMGQGKKRGFTLIETVVTVGIIAALAAVVYPQVVKQFDTADPTRFAEDLNSITTAIETFSINVRPHQPKDLEDLANQIRAAFADTDSTALGAAYGATDVINWNGPYLGVSIPEGTTDAAVILTTGFSATILNQLELYDTDAADGGAAEVTTLAANAEFLAVLIQGLSGAAFNSINALIDGTTEADAISRRHLGRFRCPGAPAPADADVCTTAFFLASPLRK